MLNSSLSFIVKTPKKEHNCNHCSEAPRRSFDLLIDFFLQDTLKSLDSMLHMVSEFLTVLITHYILVWFKSLRKM